MESLLALALEYTLKYWLKSFSRDQFKLQGRTVQLSNLDINGDALHASVGLAPALNVTTAKVGKLEIKLPYYSNVQTEPIVVQIDKLDLVLEENTDSDVITSLSSNLTSTSSGKGNGYGFADKIADGMTLEVGTVNLMLETRGGALSEGGAIWVSPLASITIHNLLLYTTNENWQVVNLKEARDFSNDKKCIYIFKKLEWGSLSVDLLPHPDMFTDARLTSRNSRDNKRDDDGAKRLFFGGECFLEGISGEAHITIQRTEQNCPLGLEVQLHVTEAVCPALSEPGLRALLRFMTGLYVCLNRGDVDPKAQQRCTEAAGRSIVSIIVDHIFLCIKDAEFQLELLMQSLFFSRVSVSDGENTKNLTRIMLAGMFLRDTFSHPPCTLVQPSMEAVADNYLNVPDFAKKFCPPIYPLGDQAWKLNECLPLICLHSLQMKPSPAPPSFASQTVIDCQPLMINLQEESCLRIASFLADGIVVNPGAVLPDFSINSLVFTLKEFDLAVPLDAKKLNNCAENGDTLSQNSFSGARLHVEDLLISQSPKLKFRLLNLEKDPACFSLWEDQPVDASQKKWTTRASLLSLSLETHCKRTEHNDSSNWSEGLWRCVELHEACFEAAMTTADGSALITMPPPGGVVRIGVACQQYLSNTSVEQLFFVLDLYAYFGRVSEEISKVGKRKAHKSRESLGVSLMENAPSDTAVRLGVRYLQFKFVESSSINIQGMPLVQFIGEDFLVNVTHRTLGGAIAVSSSVRWESVQVDCVDADITLGFGNGTKILAEQGFVVSGNGYPQMRPVFWIDKRNKRQQNGIVAMVPFLEISMVHVMPFHAQDMECHSLNVSAKVAGVRLGGGMNYTEALLHRFGILGPDGGPGEGLSKGVKNLSTGPLLKLFRASPLTGVDEEKSGVSDDGDGGGIFELGRPDDVEICIEFNDWLFALEGAEHMAEFWSYNSKDVNREERCWHTTFQSLQVKAKSTPKTIVNDTERLCMTQFPFELVTVSVDGLRALKPHARNLLPGVYSRGINRADSHLGRSNGTVDNSGGVDLEVRIVISEDDENLEVAKWVVDNLKFAVKQPIEAVATKDELEQLALLCKSEFDSMGRITAGILRVLKLDRSIGQTAIDQLSNLGSEGLDRVFTPQKLSTHGSVCSLGFTPTSNTSPNQNLDATVASLEAVVSDSQAKCSTLVSDLSNPVLSVHVEEIKQLNQNLESIQILLTQLRTQI